MSASSRFHVLTLVLFLIFSAVSDAHPVHDQSDVSVTFSDLKDKFTGLTYTVAVIKLRDSSSPTDRSNQNLARQLLTAANDWNVDIFRERYTHLPAEKFESMRRAGIALTGASSFIMIFDKKFPLKPLGSLWMYYPGADGKLEMERVLDWNFPKPEVTNEKYAMIKIETDSAEIFNIVHKQGAAVEFKRFFLDQKAPRDLMSAMLLRGESSDRLNTRTIGVGVDRNVLPNQYTLRCDRKLLPIYLRFGFKLVQEEPVKGDHIMSIDRERYVQNALRWREKAQQNGWSLQFKLDQANSKSIEAQVQANLESKACESVFHQ